MRTPETERVPPGTTVTIRGGVTAPFIGATGVVLSYRPDPLNNGAFRRPIEDLAVVELHDRTVLPTLAVLPGHLEVSK